MESNKHIDPQVIQKMKKTQSQITKIINEKEKNDKVEYLILIHFSDGLQISYQKTNTDETLDFLRSLSVICVVNNTRPIAKVDVHNYETGELFTPFEMNPFDVNQQITPQNPQTSPQLKQTSLKHHQFHDSDIRKICQKLLDLV